MDDTIESPGVGDEPQLTKAQRKRVAKKERQRKEKSSAKIRQKKEDLLREILQKQAEELERKAHSQTQAVVKKIETGKQNIIKEQAEMLKRETEAQLHKEIIATAQSQLQREIQSKLQPQFPQPQAQHDQESDLFESEISQESTNPESPKTLKQPEFEKVFESKHDNSTITNESDPDHTIIDMNKFIYIGQVNKGLKPHGYGQCKNKENETRYQGDFKQGVFDGSGKMYDETGVLRYEGEFKNNKKWGKGRTYHPNGFLEYDASFKNNMVQGYGKLCYADKAGLVEYDGYFRASEFHGVGKHYHHNGKVKYEGEFKDGCRNGKGKLYDNKGGLILKGVFNSTNKD